MFVCFFKFPVPLFLILSHIIAENILPSEKKDELLSFSSSLPSSISSTLCREGFKQASSYQATGYTLIGSDSFFLCSLCLLHGVNCCYVLLVTHNLVSEGGSASSHFPLLFSWTFAPVLNAEVTSGFARFPHREAGYGDLKQLSFPNVTNPFKNTRGSPMVHCEALFRREWDYHHWKDVFSWCCPSFRYSTNPKALTYKVF